MSSQSCFLDLSTRSATACWSSAARCDCFFVFRLAKERLYDTAGIKLSHHTKKKTAFTSKQHVVKGDKDEILTVQGFQKHTIGTMKRDGRSGSSTLYVFGREDTQSARLARQKRDRRIFPHSSIQPSNVNNPCRKATGCREA